MTQKTREETIKTKPLYRTFEVARGKIDVENRTAELSFSSETPYERYFGTEILDHGNGSMRADRLKAGAAVLLDHDREKLVGRVDAFGIGEDRRGNAIARFGRSQMAQEAFVDVQDGIRHQVSVGYFVHRMVLEKEEDGHETYRVTDWEPFEISLVSIAADITVGVGRASDEEVSTIVVRSVTEPEPVVDVVKPLLSIKENQMTQVIEKPDTEAIEKARRDSIVAMGEQYGKYVTDKDVLRHVMEGKTVAQFQDYVMQRMESSHTNTNDLKLGMSKGEVQRYSLLRAINAQITGDWSKAGLERSASEAMTKLLGQNPSGFYVPYDAFQRDFTAGTAAEAGNLVATDLRGDLFTDVLRNALVLVGMGQRVLTGLSGNIDIPRKTVPGSISRVTEVAALTETQPTTAKLTLSPKRFGGFVEYSKQAIIQANTSVEAMLRDDLLMGAAVDLQDQCLNGSGSSPNMRGIRNTAGIGSVVGGTNGLAFNWTHAVGLESACANVNAEPNTMAGYVLNTKTRGTAKTTQKATNLPFMWDNGANPLNGYRAAVTNAMPSNLTKGSSSGVCSSVMFGSDFSMSVLALFGAPDITVDPYSLATTGLVRITLNQFADHGVRLPACFAVMDDALTP